MPLRRRAGAARNRMQTNPAGIGRSNPEFCMHTVMAGRSKTRSAGMTMVMAGRSKTRSAGVRMAMAACSTCVPRMPPACGAIQIGLKQRREARRLGGGGLAQRAVLEHGHFHRVVPLAHGLAHATHGDDR